MAIKEKKKNNAGTKMTLLVPAKKSAAASITSIAFLRESQLQKMAQVYIRQMIPQAQSAPIY
jgi:hypothetical protein